VKISVHVKLIVVGSYMSRTWLPSWPLSSKLTGTKLNSWKEKFLTLLTPKPINEGDPGPVPTN